MKKRIGREDRVAMGVSGRERFHVDGWMGTQQSATDDTDES